MTSDGADREPEDVEIRLAEHERRLDEVRVAARILEQNLREMIRSAQRLWKTIGDDTDVADDDEVTSTLGDVRADG